MAAPADPDDALRRAVLKLAAETDDPDCRAWLMALATGKRDPGPTGPKK